MSVTENYYEILQVHQSAEPEVIEAAYRQLLRMYHPDVNNSAEAHEIIVQLNRAYEMLSDLAKRAEYDRSRTNQVREEHRPEEEQMEKRDVQQETEREYVSNARSSGWTPLHIAAARGHADAVELLITAGAEVNARNKNGMACLHSAAGGGHTGILKSLIALGAEVDVRDINEWTPLHITASRGLADAMDLLIAAGAEVDVRDKTGRTPLHSAALNGHKDIVESLIALGVEVDVRDKVQWTPLHYATSKGHTDIVESLIALGAEVDARS